MDVLDRIATSYTEWAAQQRHEPGAGLSPRDKVWSFLADSLNVLHFRAVRQRIAGDKRARRDAREQFLARMSAI